MLTKIILYDARHNKGSTAIIAAFMTVAVLLTVLASFLMVSLGGSIHHLMEEAKTPHFLQMHTGPLDRDRLARFAASHAQVTDWQVSGFVNIDGADFHVNDGTLADSVQDNGIVTQSSHHDYLLDADNRIIQPNPGEIYAPLTYFRSGSMKIGDNISLYGKSFTLAGFLRDSQMNASLSSSKRFLVHETDYQQVAPHGHTEHLISFRLHDLDRLSDFERDYLQAGLETGGPTITYPMFRMINGLTDGLMIAILLLISGLAIGISFLCIHLTLLATIEEDYTQIGVLKATGIRLGEIKKIYLLKYSVLAVFAAMVGYALSLPIRRPLSANMHLFMGDGGNALEASMAGLAGALLVCLLVTGYVWLMLRRFNRLSAAEAIRFGAPQTDALGHSRWQLNRHMPWPGAAALGIKDLIARPRQYVTLWLVFVLASFMVLLPGNISDTVSSDKFITYLGIGASDMRIGIQQTDNLEYKAADIADRMASDDRISRFALYRTVNLQGVGSDGNRHQVNIALGDFNAFPLSYLEGRAPQADNEIALSALNADALGKYPGDTLTLYDAEQPRTLHVVGLYSDISNGGKTAQGSFIPLEDNLSWITIQAGFHHPEEGAAIVSDYHSAYPFAAVADLATYSDQIFGNTLQIIQRTSAIAFATSVILSFLVTLLYVGLLVTKDRRQISIQKTLGFSSRALQGQYAVRIALVLILGLTTGALLTATLGAQAGGLLLSFMGVRHFRFLSDPLFILLIAPGGLASGIALAVLLRMRRIAVILPANHIKE